MSKPPKEQVVTNRLDPAMEKYRNEVLNRARNVANEGYTEYGGPTIARADPLSRQGAQGMQGAADQMGNLLNLNLGHNVGPGFNTNPYEQAGAAGARAMSGDRSAVESLMNPYQSQVMDQLGGQFDRLRTQAARSTGAEATAGGAFGGDRHALLTGERLGGIDRAQGDATANLLYSGFNDTMGRAAGAANLGLGAGQIGNQFALGAGGQRLGALGQAGNMAGGQFDASQGLLGAGDYFRGIDQAGMDDAQRRFNDRRSWGERGLNIMSGPLGGPHGTTQAQPLHSNKFAGAAGGATTGMALGGPWGAALGGLGGLLFG